MDPKNFFVVSFYSFCFEELIYQTALNTTKIKIEIRQLFDTRSFPIKIVKAFCREIF